MGPACLLLPPYGNLMFACCAASRDSQKMKGSAIVRQQFFLVFVRYYIHTRVVIQSAVAPQLSHSLRAALAARASGQVDLVLHDAQHLWHAGLRRVHARRAVLDRQRPISTGTTSVLPPASSVAPRASSAARASSPTIGTALTESGGSSSSITSTPSRGVLV